MPPIHTTEIIQAALDGFERQKQKIDQQIAELRQMLSGHLSKSTTAESPKVRKKVSAAGRRRMAEGQKRRWAAKRGEREKSPSAPEAVKPKRKLSAAGRKRIIAATKARWARIHAEAAKKASSR
jgi:hypothetical protein